MRTSREVAGFGAFDVDRAGEGVRAEVGELHLFRNVDDVFQNVSRLTPPFAKNATGPSAALRP